MTTLTHERIDPPSRDRYDFRPMSRTWAIASKYRRLREPNTSPRVAAYKGGPDFISHSELLEYVERHISPFLLSGQIGPRTAARARRLFARLPARTRIVFPHMSAAEGELNALWLAGRMSIEMSVPASGRIYIRITDMNGREMFVGFFDTVPVDILRRHLQALTLMVEAENPKWREIFES